MLTLILLVNAELIFAPGYDTLWCMQLPEGGASNFAPLREFVHFRRKIDTHQFGRPPLHDDAC